MEKPKGFTDMHTHFVYGVDDGAQSKEIMESMLDMANENRITTLYATSHSTPGIKPFPETTYLAHLEEARAYCAEKGYPITLHTGTEILYTPALRNYLERKPLRTLGKSDYVLIEFVPDIRYSEITEAVSMVLDAGYVPVVAHIERYGCLYTGARVKKLKQEYEVELQVNCNTAIRGIGLLKTPIVRGWFRDGLIDCVSSDMHNLTERRNRMREAYAALKAEYGRGYAQKLTHWQPQD